MKTQLYIPQKVKVGYQKRDDTYTKRLAYIIYYDDKGTLRKETSWKNWVEAKLGTPDYENKPTEGFVLNKDVGGVRHSWSSWNNRMEKVRVFDPRGFEFEITIPNLLFILQECSSVKGKGLEGEFVYSWDGADLVLLPVKCEEYIKCAEFTALQSNKVAKKELIEGASYMTKKQEVLIYLGQFHTYGNINYYYDGMALNLGKEMVFYNEKDKRYEQRSSMDFISHMISDQCHPKFAKFVQDLTEKAVIGKASALIADKDKIIFNEGRNYYGNDWTAKSGHEYKGGRRGKSGNPLEQPFAKTYYIPLTDNSYQVVTPNRVRKEVKGDKNMDYYFNWELVGFKLTSSKVVSIEDGVVTMKAAKNPYLGKIFTQGEMEKLDTYNVKIKLRNNKTHAI